MKFKEKMISMLAVVLCISSMTACSNGQDGTRVVFTTGFGKNEIFRIEGENCTRNELMVYLTTTQNQYEEVYGEEIWNTSLNGVTLEENIKEIVLAKIAQIKTMYLLAKDKGIELEEKEEAQIKAATEEYFQSLSDKERELLEVSREDIESLYREYAMADKVYHYIIQDVNPEISDDEARIITVQHILITGSYEKASEVHDLAVSGEYDFAELASKYSEDSNITYSFGKGEAEEVYEKEAFLLETDQISQIVKGTEGYYIIKCITTFNREETDANKLKIVEQRKNEVFGQEYDAFVKTLVRNLNEELWSEITFIRDSEVTTSDFFTIYEKYFS
ncbi:MAG: peptidylprolyl isomerase [Lachnospiraceae bacterium]|nr:peptidylprolyl isomerase [Lachnospiraceae bacterium]